MTAAATVTASKAKQPETKPQQETLSLGRFALLAMTESDAVSASPQGKSRSSPPPLARPRECDAIVQSEVAVLPELDLFGREPIPPPIGWPGNLAFAEPGGIVHDQLLEPLRADSSGRDCWLAHAPIRLWG